MAHKTIALTTELRVLTHIRPYIGIQKILWSTGLLVWACGVCRTCPGCAVSGAAYWGVLVGLPIGMCLLGLLRVSFGASFGELLLHDSGKLFG